MSTRIVRENGDEILRKKSKDVTEITDRIKELIIDMKESMQEHKGCGLAAVQVGVLRNIIVVQPDEKGEILTFINPKILYKSDETEKGVEGCLSVSGKKGIVERAKTIRFTAMDENLKEEEMEAEGFLARIIQHEVDHLEGNLYIDKVDGKVYNVDEKIPGYEDENEEESGEQ